MRRWHIRHFATSSRRLGTAILSCVVYLYPTRSSDELLTASAQVPLRRRRAVGHGCSLRSSESKLRSGMRVDGNGIAKLEAWLGHWQKTRLRRRVLSKLISSAGDGIADGMQAAANALRQKISL